MTVGLLPITLVVGPLLPLGLILMALPMLVFSVFGFNPLKLLDGSLPLFLSIIFGAIGLPAVWAAFLLDSRKYGSRFRYGIALALFLGLAGDAYWIRLVLFTPSLPSPRYVTSIWTCCSHPWWSL
jgi:uncharacterized membrane protein YuzA (DUF378 family)